MSDVDLNALYDFVARRVAELVETVDLRVGSDDIDRKIQLSRIAFEHVEETARRQEEAPDDPTAQRRRAVALTTYTLLNLPRGETADGTSSELRGAQGS
jgi:hypothetical protein